VPRVAVRYSSPMAEPSRPRVRSVVVIGVFFTSFSAILVRWSQAPPITVAFFRMFFASALLLPFFLRSDARGGMTRRDILISVISGCFLALHFATWITSLDLTTVASSTVLVDMHPLLVYGAGIVFLGEFPSRRRLFMIGISVIGAVVLSWGDWAVGPEAFRGDVLAFLGAVFVTGYMIIGRTVRSRLTLTAYTFLVYFSAASLLGGISLVGPFVDSGTTSTILTLLPAREYLIFGALTLFCTLLGHSLLNWSLRYVSPSFVSVAWLAEPVFATVLAVLLLGEIPGITNIVGGGVILGSIYGFIRIEPTA
jgi:drug/metabolite transporter (DMT)-like permease